MMDAISITNLTKKYVLGKTNIVSFYKDNFDQENIKSKLALNDINLEIKHNDRVALVGKNGSGKSTLCKILSRVTFPTKGKVMVNGKVSSILEAGAGFHPELSGRENIYLSGSMLGMNKNKIYSLYEKIINFAEVQDYIDTPVKRYSTGMSLKLAVAISLFLDGDILIYDEILAVADEKFRKLATQEINKKVDNEKKTLLLVSHQKQNLLDVCNKAILLDNGKILNIDSPEKILHEYEKLINN
jgi:lipopolysaccharide transport system ATP-binding protein